jgi:hypothetical protein
MINTARTSADEVAVNVLRGVDRGSHLILFGRDGKLAYATKRFARLLYNRQMAKLAANLARKA